MRILVIIVAVFAAIVIGLSVYLGPDDLSQCGAHPTADQPCQPAQAIVAVSGGDTIARTDEAIKLYKDGWAPLLIFSGAAEDKSGPSNAAVMRKEAMRAGVSADAILVEEYSETTKQNAEKTQTIFEKHGITSIILVTSAYHQRRAGLEFKARSGGTVTVRNHPVPHDDQWSTWWWLTPVGWWLAVTEFVKIIAFYIGGSR